MFIEAAHDVTLQAILSGLGFNSPFIIDTSASMAFELHENSFGHSVQVIMHFFLNQRTYLNTQNDVL
jgi:hypothetical protein